jgi:hypothetical protein
MVAKKQAGVGRDIIANARRVLAFAKQRAAEVQYRNQLSNAIYAPDGMAILLFPTEPELKAFLRTKEHKQIRKLMVDLPYPPPTETIVIRIPPSENGKKKRR